ncbi:hypothetical protein HBI55_120940 [Parastagonospora nodorum]|nr:hypothetical protein HBI09_132450 [Parastagonospora nodorum]KAH4198097.1 hypothetical protein HBI95_184390 [Parastagonospora nodorum]KAH5001310.1 hypothetical protein HBI77_145500 [Parastagonospora nodorum]KAH5111918.1 hypothetical protein HBH71_166280 [Parastagonospora nodorum]KAH6011384.1 hypothetical protein HBI83_161350 [Parastagonospora nodorum]
MRIMNKYSFHDDYSEGAHPKVLEALTRTNLLQQSGYGDDEYSQQARTAIRKLIGAESPMIHFTPGGTGANLLSIASYLRPHEAIIAVEGGHIVGKEGGAIEATGHKIITDPGMDGKLSPLMIQAAVDRSSAFAFQPKAKMVFISNSTEIGTIYNKSELTAISNICKELNLLLMLDGARLGAAMASSENDMTMQNIYELTDIFWIGGTKNGALLGEAVVIKDPNFGADFQYHMKQRGALLAKGRVLGIQFSTLLQDNLFFQLAEHANKAAAEISLALTDLGYRLWAKTQSNQVFIIFPLALIEVLQHHFDFFIWQKLDESSSVVRIVTSWATDRSEGKRFCETVEKWGDAL